MGKRVDIESIIRVYEATHSIWKTGKQLGVPGQTVHERLRKHGVPITGNTAWTEEELDEVRTMVESSVSIKEMAERLNRTYAGVACKLNEIGFTNYRKVQRKKVRNKSGYDKASVKKHLAFLTANPTVKITQHCRSVGLNVDSLVYALQKHFPTEFDQYLLAHHGDIVRRACVGCGANFVPSNGKQQFCTRTCASAHHQDRKYFGGKRMTAVGMRERECQVCAKVNATTMHAHHVIGKVNDPDNNHMVALCAGCHRLVGFAARVRGLVDSPEAWRRLIRLAWFEAHGAEFSGVAVLPDMAEPELPKPS